MKTTEIEQQLKDKSHKEIHETLNIMFDELYKLYDKYGMTKNRFIYLKCKESYGGVPKEMSFSCLDDFKSTMIRLVKEDITDRMVEKKTKDLLDKMELI